jgi:hypothetical protein
MNIPSRCRAPPYLRWNRGRAVGIGACLTTSCRGTGKLEARCFAAAPAGNGITGVLIDQAFADLEDRVMDVDAVNVMRWLNGPQESRRVRPTLAP